MTTLGRPAKLGAAILEYYHANPKATATVIAQETGASRAYVCQVMKKNGVSSMRHRRKKIPLVNISLLTENHDFLVDEATKAGVTLAVMLNAIMDDARLEDE